MRANRIAKILWATLVFALPALILYHFYAPVFACPACYLFQDTGDGLKNYYTLAWYVVHDQGWHFTGMNYPYGENIIYTDNQPLLALLLRWMHHHILPMDRHIVGTLNLLLILSLYLGVLVNYHLLRRWNTGRWWALGSAACIIFLSPQIMRFHGHYGLAYVFFIPLLLLVLDYIVRGPGRKWMWGLLAGLLILATSLIHLYFLFLHLLVVLAFLLCWAWQKRKDAVVFRRVAITLTGVILLPGAILLGIRKYTDPVTDRPTEPWGIDYHTIDFKTTFFSFIHPFDYAWTKFFGIERPIMEKIAYTGLIGLLMLPAMIWFLFRKKPENDTDVMVKALAGAALITWCMGAGIFYQHGLKGVWEAIPVLKQFRGLGRFGLPFYYLYTLACSYVLWRFFDRLRYRSLMRPASYVLGAVSLIWGFEAYVNMAEQSAPITHENTILTDTKKTYLPLIDSAGYAPGDFQAILQLPLVVVGNENLGVVRGFWTLSEGMHVGWETGLPLMDYSMSRTSIRQGLDMLEMIADPSVTKRRAKLLQDKPLLLVCDESLMIPAEKRWLPLAKPLGKRGSISLYSISPAVFSTSRVPDPSSLERLQPCRGWFMDFEDHPCDTAMSGKGALPITYPGFPVWSYVDTVVGERQWIVSFWSYVDDKHASVAMPKIIEWDYLGSMIQATGWHRDLIDWAEVQGSWMQVNIPLTTRGRGYNYQLLIDNAGTVIDNLSIRPSTDTCLTRLPDQILINNIPVARR